MKIWALFSIANEYNQPDNNLEALFQYKPKISELAIKIYNKSLEQCYDDEIICLAQIARLEKVRISESDFRIEEVDVIEN